LWAAVAGVAFGAPGFGAALPLAFAFLAGNGAFSPGLGPGFAADVFFFGALFGFGAAAVSSATRAGDG